MAGDNKVVDLQKIKSDAEQARADALAIPLPVMKLTALFKTIVVTSFKKMFDNADDILFARADRAGSGADQKAYFDAMRDLRLNKKSIEGTFLKTVGTGIQNLDKPQTNIKEATLICADELSLVGLDDMESEVAIESMVAKIKDHAARPIEQLQIRIQTLYPTVEISSERMPFGPANLCHAFADALSGLDMDIRPRLIIFKLFERFFTDSLAQFYVAANQLLVKLGILPEMVAMRGPSRASGSAASSASTATPQAADSQHSGGSGADEGLMSDEVGLSGAPISGGYTTGNAPSHRAATGSVPGRSQAGTAPAGHGGVSFALLQQALRSNFRDANGGGEQTPAAGQGNATSALSAQELVQAVSACESQFYAQNGRSSEAASAQTLIADLLASVQHQFSRKGERKAIRQQEADVASLVSLLFNYVLEDDQLPEQLKRILATWQIPFLKLALLDPSFFEKDSHPARHLLNQVSKAALGWQPKERGRDLLLEKIEKFTERMLHEFDTDAEVFREINQEMSVFLDAEKRRSSLISQRLKDAEEGRVKSELARKKVSATLASLMFGKRIPSALVRALEVGWARQMNIAWLQGGEQGGSWQEACAFAKELIWTIDPAEKGVEARQKLLHLVPATMRGLREGLMEVSYDLRELDKAMAALDLSHKDALRRIEQVDEPAPVLPSERRADIREPATVTPLPLPATAGDDAPSSDAVENVALAESSIAGDSLADSAPKTEAETIWEQRVDQLRLGSWFEYLPQSGEKQRFKLAAAIKLNGRHVFVNRNGVKMAEFEKADLIKELASGRLMPLDDGQIFDRALESIISGLRR